MAFQPDVTYQKNEYIETDTGNKVSRRATIQGPQNIILAGKSLILPGSILRGDLRRLASPSSSSAGGSGGGGAKGSVIISLGRYCVIGKGAVVRPPGKCYRGSFNYYPVKVGDHVSIGAGSVVEAAQIGNCVTIGRNCVVGKFALLKDCCSLADNTILPDLSVVPPFARIAGAPGVCVGEEGESWEEEVVKRSRAFYARFRAAPAAGGGKGREASTAGAGASAG